MSNGVFNSKVPAIPAVKATGTNGAQGVDVTTDTGTGLDVVVGGSKALGPTSDGTGINVSTLLGTGISVQAGDTSQEGQLSDGTGVNVSATLGTGINVAVTNGALNSEGKGVNATTQLGTAGQFQSAGGIGVVASAGLPDKGDPTIQGIGVSATGNIAVQAQGNATQGIGVSASGNIAVQATSATGFALVAEMTGPDDGGAAQFVNSNPQNANPALAAISEGFFAGSAFPQAADFVGDVDVTGTLSASAKSFVIDHPLDPANKYLVHASVESSERANVYSGNIVLNDHGEAVVHLPAWAEALSADFRYQLTCVGGSALVYIAEELADNQFRIAGGTAGLKVSWQLTGIRKDAWAKAHPLVVEQEKPETEKAYFRHPELFGSDRQHNVMYRRVPKLGELLQQSRDQ
jgi:trimeric autotransporter adhesin